ncbi:hypothetical protein [Petrachloros mirabilis]
MTKEERSELLTNAAEWLRNITTDIMAPEGRAIVDGLFALRDELENLEPVAWIVTGGSLFADRAFTSEENAMRSATSRKDGAKVVPLYLGLRLDAITKD